MIQAATSQTREALLQDFVDWAAKHVRGDEKGEAQVFIDHLFCAFGQKGANDVGGTFEHRVKKDKSDRGVTSFTAHGVPPAYGDPAKLITDDCIRP